MNDAPTTTAVTLTAIAEDSGARTITQAELLVNSSDVENDTRTVSNVSIATGTGTLVDNGNGTWTYTPAANDDTSVSFSYTITDNGTTNGVADGKTVGGTATLDITPVNDAPSGADATLSVARNGSQALGVGDFGFSDTENNGFLAVKITQLPTAGTLTLAGVAVTVDQVISAADIAAGKLVFAPALNAAGTGYANIKFAVQDDGGTANGGIDLDASSNTITFNVTGGGGGGGGGGGTGGNTVPVAANDSGSGLEDAVSMTGNVLSNDTDGDVDALTVTGFTVAGVTGTHAAGATVSLVGVGSLTLGADGGYSFVPVANYNGNCQWSLIRYRTVLTRRRPH